MKALIIEDEVLAAKALQKLLGEVSPETEVLSILETIEESLEWFENNEMPDLLFMDIHLADGSAFSIFEKVEITCPIIFTTAYDEYALKAFEVNSIDYLLKPINKKDLKRAMGKYKTLVSGRAQMQKFMTQMEPRQKKYRNCFLMPERDKLVPLPVERIAYVYIDTKTVRIVTFEHKNYYMSMTLDELMDMLDPTLFFRANRQFIVARSAIKDISVWFGNKLSVNLSIEVPEKIIISKAKVSEFKAWILG
jgi:two-component system LytT family response regulator